MKIIFVACVIAAVAASPVKKVDKDATTVAPVNGTTEAPVTNATTLAPSRSKRDCTNADLKKIKPKLTIVLTQEFEKILNGTIKLHDVSTTSKKTVRAVSTSASASSSVGPNGETKSTANAKSNVSGKDKVTTEAPILTNGHQLPLEPDVGSGGGGGNGDDYDDEHHHDLMKAGAGAPGAPGGVGGGKGGSGGSGGGKGGAPGKPGLPPPPPSGGKGGKGGDKEVPPTSTETSGGGGGGGANATTAAPEVVAQNVAAAANMHNGSAVAQAISKRAIVNQNVSALAANAFGNVESHKGADVNIQTVQAHGSQTGIANALVDDRNATGNSTHKLTNQVVSASGKTAAAAATIKKNGGNAIQDATAVGDESAVASAGIEPGRVRRALCAPHKEIKLDDNLRAHIKQFIEDAIENLQLDN